jgi:hypothetical protein
MTRDEQGDVMEVANDCHYFVCSIIILMLLGTHAQE